MFVYNDLCWSVVIIFYNFMVEIVKIRQWKICVSVNFTTKSYVGQWNLIFVCNDYEKLVCWSV